MTKNIIVSFDDIYKGNDRWEALQKIKKEIPEFKVTLFVITKDDAEYWKSIKTDWTELVFHSYEHDCQCLKWTQEEAEKYMQYYQQFGFSNGFKAPGWDMTENMANAVKRLNFWVCVRPSLCREEARKNIRFNFNNKWMTTRPGLYVSDAYVELWGHAQDIDFDAKLDSLREYYKLNNGNFKFISEVVKNYEKL